MLDYRIVLFFLSFAVDVLLLLAANRLCGYPGKVWKILCAGVIGGGYRVWCVLPGFHFLGSFWWHIVFLGVTGVVAYGLFLNAIRRIAIFVFLSLALSGVMTGVGRGGVVEWISALCMILLLSFFGFRNRIGVNSYLPVELSYGDKHLQITALQDTGNTLCDPITGRQVLVVGADVAEALLGLTPKQLRTPIESIAVLPGLRLIPYRTIDQNSFLLAMHLPRVKIGQWRGDSLVAFAPNSLSQEGTYQALTGGVI